MILSIMMPPPATDARRVEGARYRLSRNAKWCAGSDAGARSRFPGEKRRSEALSWQPNVPTHETHDMAIGYRCDGWPQLRSRKSRYCWQTDGWVACGEQKGTLTLSAASRIEDTRAPHRRFPESEA